MDKYHIVKPGLSICTSCAAGRPASRGRIPANLRTAPTSSASIKAPGAPGRPPPAADSPAFNHLSPGTSPRPGKPPSQPDRRPIKSAVTFNLRRPPCKPQPRPRLSPHKPSAPPADHQNATLNALSPLVLEMEGIRAMGTRCKRDAKEREKRRLTWDVLTPLEK